MIDLRGTPPRLPISDSPSPRSVNSDTPLSPTAASSAIFSRIFPLERAKSCPSSPRSSPNRFRWSPRKDSKDSLLLAAVNEFKTEDTYKCIAFLTEKIESLNSQLSQESPRVQWQYSTFSSKAREIETAIPILKEKLDQTWNNYIQNLLNWKVNSTELFLQDKTQILTDIHGKEVKLTLLKQLSSGGYFNAWLVELPSGIEAVLLVAHQGVSAIERDWKKEQIESIIWREKITGELKFKDRGFFPEHLHTFILMDPATSWPVACYLLEKLNPISESNNIIKTCEELIELLQNFHNKLLVHGDISSNNLMQLEDVPYLIDLDPNSFVNFSDFNKMDPEEQKKQWETIKIADITPLFTPPGFKDLIATLIPPPNQAQNTNIELVMAYLKVKDRYGLALSIWELCTNQNLSKFETSNTLSEENFRALLKTIQTSKKLSLFLKEWMTEALNEGFSLSSCRSEVKI